MTKRKILSLPELRNVDADYCYAKIRSNGCHCPIASITQRTGVHCHSGRAVCSRVRRVLTTIRPMLNTNSTDYPDMLDSTADRDDPKRLTERMEEDGYLYFRRLVAPERVLPVKQDIIDLLQEHFILEANGATEPMWSGGPEPTETEYMAVYDRIARLDSFQQLASSPELITVLETLCGESVRVWVQKLIRIVYPQPEMTTAGGVGAHQDGDPKLGYQAQRFYTTWIALMDIDLAVGGLAVSPGSHKRGILKSAGTVASSGRNVKDKAYGLDPDTLDWATTAFEPGGAVIFHCRTVHRGMPNHSDRVRLSADFRYQPVSESASWMANTLGPDVRRVVQAIDETINSRALYVAAQPSPEILGELRHAMIEEKDASLERTIELVHEIKSQEE